MRLGSSTSKASKDAIRRILKFYPSYIGAVIAVDAKGEHAAAAAGWTFEYAARSRASNATQIFEIQPLDKTALSTVQ